MSNVLVCGRMKEGKTTLALWIARNWQCGGVVIWDPRHMIDQEMITPIGFTGIVYAYNSEELEQAIENFQPGQLVVYRPTSIEPEADFNELCAVLLDPPEKYHNWSLVVDEAAQLQSAQKIHAHLSRAIRQHPRSVLIVQTTHSLQDWHRASKDLVNHLFCFRLVGRSLVAVIDFCDGSDEMKETVKNLPPHTCIHISFESRAGSREFTVIEPSQWYEGGEDVSQEHEDEQSEAEMEQESSDSSD